MQKLWFWALMAMAIVFPVEDARSQSNLTGEDILALAREAAGGDGWANARSLALSGHAIFYGNKGHLPRSIANDYRMWRIFDPERNDAHGAKARFGSLHIQRQKNI